MEVGKEEEEEKKRKKNPEAHTQQSGAALPLPRSPSPPSNDHRRLNPITPERSPAPPRAVHRGGGGQGGGGGGGGPRIQVPAGGGGGASRAPSHQFHTEPKADRSIFCRTPSPATSSPSASFDALKKGLMGPSSAPCACSSEGVGAGGREPKEEGWGRERFTK